MIFHDRYDAGERLVEPLLRLHLRNPLVLGIPRGGVAVAAAIAEKLPAELDVVLTHKLGAPGQPELAIGAVDESGHITLAPYAKSVSQAYIEEEAANQLEVMQQRGRLFRAVKPMAAMTDRSVILVDDGLATGWTMFAAIDVVKRYRPYQLIVAIPVGAKETVDKLRSVCDRVICLQSPANFMAVGEFYESFQSTEESEVVELLKRSKKYAATQTDQ
jgi:putative phosphoribosyl transferase